MEAILLQLRADDKTSDARAKRVKEFLSKHTAEVDLVVLPELWQHGIPDFSTCKEKAETLTGKTAGFLSKQARALSAYLIGGSIIEKHRGKLYNTSPVFDPNGQMISSYRKRHLTSYHSHESKVLSPGNDTQVITTPFAKIGLAICYDLRFPMLFKDLVLAGAEVLVVPAAWPMTRMEAWESLCRARAVENQAYLIACGTAGGGLLGRSMIVDPWGVKVASLGEQEGVLKATLNLEQLREFRRELKAWREH